MKYLNKKETVGDLLDAFKEVSLVYALHLLLLKMNLPLKHSDFFIFNLINQKPAVAPQEHEPTPSPSPESQSPAVCSPTAEEPDLTWEVELDSENVEPNILPETDNKCQLKEGKNSRRCFIELFALSLFVATTAFYLTFDPSHNQDAISTSHRSRSLCYVILLEERKPNNPEEKRQYDREFLLTFQCIQVNMTKPTGLPDITGIVLEKTHVLKVQLLITSQIKRTFQSPSILKKHFNNYWFPFRRKSPSIS